MTMVEVRGMRVAAVAMFVIAAFAAAAARPGPAAAQTLPGCAVGAAPGLPVFTVGVSASGKPFVTYYVASAPVAGGNVGCAAPAAPPTISITPPAYAYPTAPAVPAVSPVPVNVVQVGSTMLTVPANPNVQVYQIAPGYYVVRSTDGTQNVNIVTPLPPAPAAPNTGPMPSVVH
jgi:hypothetical protein